MNRITVHGSKSAAMRAARKTDGWVAHEVDVSGAWVWVAYPDDETYVEANYGPFPRATLFRGLARMRERNRRHVYQLEVIGGIEGFLAHAP